MRSHDKARFIRAIQDNRPLGDDDVMFVRGRRSGNVGPGGFGPGPFSGGPFGPGAFGPGPYGPRGGRGPGRRGLRRRRGDVRVALLLLLDIDGPANGYQLMQALGERSQGRWTPSPGSVYPALSQLEDEGLIRAVESDAGRMFELTDAGRTAVAERGDERAPWEPGDDPGVEAALSIRHLIVSTGRAAWQVVQDGDEQQLAKARELLLETRRGLYRLLADGAEASGGDDPAGESDSTTA